VASANTPQQLAKGFAAGMAATLRDDASLHRLWYDLRTQSMFEKSFQAPCAEIDHSLERMIWRIVTSYSTLSGTQPRVSSPLAYGLFDGLFQQALRHWLQGDANAPKLLAAQTEQTLIELFPTTASSDRAKRTSSRRSGKALRGA
jgi:hypothetical protein